jgi:hypothetical protein
MVVHDANSPSGQQWTIRGLGYLVPTVWKAVITADSNITASVRSGSMDLAADNGFFQWSKCNYHRPNNLFITVYQLTIFSSPITTMMVQNPSACWSIFCSTIVSCPLLQRPAIFHLIQMLHLFSEQSWRANTCVVSGASTTVWLEHGLMFDGQPHSLYGEIWMGTYLSNSLVDTG